MNLLSKMFRKDDEAAAQRPEAPTAAAAPRDDPWFRSHYEQAAGIVLDLVPRECLAPGRTILDFGCGDGITALGVASRSEAQVVGVDLYRTYEALAGLCEANLGRRELPGNLSFVQTRNGDPLPFAEGSIDLVYSWSVFEHLADPRAILADFSRITRPGGFLFIQVEPLFHGPYGSHLRRLVDEPWAHLHYPEREFLERAAAARDRLPESEHDVLYRTNAFDEVKRHLIDEYKHLNRITAEDLVRLVEGAGFEIRWTRLIREENLAPHPALLERYPLDLLLTNQVVLLARKR